MIKPTIQLVSRPRLGEGCIEKVFLGLVGRNSCVTCGLVWVCWMSASRFLIIESNKSSVSFFGGIMSKFFHLIYFN